MVVSAFGVASLWLLGQQMLLWLRRQLCLRLEADASVLRRLASLRQMLMASVLRSLATVLPCFLMHFLHTQTLWRSPSESEGGSQCSLGHFSPD